MGATDLYWLPEMHDWRGRAIALGKNPELAWPEAVALANARLDFLRTNALDEQIRKVLGEAPPAGVLGKPVRLAILGSSTLAHLHSAIRVAGLRRKIWITTYENDYGQYFQELMDSSSELHAFRPTAVLFAFDARHLTQGMHAGLPAGEVRAIIDEALQRIRQCWSLARQAFGCSILQQTIINGLAGILGQNEHRLPGSRSHMIITLNNALREMAETEGIDIVSLDRQVDHDGLTSWHDPSLWHRTKQEVLPTAAPRYGELVARVIAAKKGQSAKCLVLDLDNTLWGGVIGDDGLPGIVLGQGSGEGEAFLAFQDYARELSRRGIILAVCSKNDEQNAWEPFDQHPEILLKRNDIACFQANWNDKASNIRIIAEKLNIGLDSLVFVDDNPFERSLVRQELPMVAVPEFPEDPARLPQLLADAGYFEAVTVTEEDRERTQLYQVNMARESFKSTATDLDSYLRGLEMQLLWRPFDQVGLQRTLQLINKTNQFNLTTRRYTEDGVSQIIDDARSFGLQLRLLDRFGDNGIISIIIGRMHEPEVVTLDTWLMSCRVLGRQVERASLDLVVQEATRLGAKKLIGEYLPTKKNGMVKDHYQNLGFDVTERHPDGASVAFLDLATYVPAQTCLEIKQG
jgi:FkbH-like protein